MLNAHLKFQFSPFFSEIMEQGLLIGLGRYVHLIDHDVAVGIITAFEYGLAVGDIDLVRGDDFGDAGHEAFLVGTAGW